MGYDGAHTVLSYILSQNNQSCIKGLFVAQDSACGQLFFQGPSVSETAARPVLKISVIVLK